MSKPSVFSVWQQVSLTPANTPYIYTVNDMDVKQADKKAVSIKASAGGVLTKAHVYIPAGNKSIDASLVTGFAFTNSTDRIVVLDKVPLSSFTI